ncbi:Rv1355c family protein [Algoriphagus halophytocola]|uniref:Rv1355c family protein n=1 Tax=Algoriphagus halophytocola TaxID=2991499 RepID=A0ABY6MIR9_9BACT|nr:MULTISPECIES: Rv1355c family protein [unclassified Algoriphagus]UZD22561.1 Rv1355c family protein [Algoriphagus sp. TR-M5]WBL43824.1 Rv1355c family protein [Algoriphagus sp. TR-M9]
MVITKKYDPINQYYPVIFSMEESSDISAANELLASGNIRMMDELDNQVLELIKAQSPSQDFKSDELREKLSDFWDTNDRETYGNWVYYPWKFCMVRLLPEEDFITVRTQRNKYKITQAEQDALRKKKIGIIGLSVGQSIAFSIALERSCGELRLADFDHLELGNMNRIKAGVTDLGVEKVVIAAREISEIDPYLKLKVYREGISEENIAEFLAGEHPLDLLIDECDSLNIKILAREKARSFGIPVLMETSDRGMLDVERFDLQPHRPVFHGLVGDLSYASLSNLPEKQKVPMALKITGIKTVSTRMKVSLLEVKQTIASWPQLASAVYLGGATVAHASRKLLLGEEVASGRYFVDLDELLQPQRDPVLGNLQAEDKTEADFAKFLPKTGEVSDYKLSQAELVELLSKVNTAPSGGNCQPWKWIFDQKGVLHLMHDKSRSISLLDFKGTGSLIAFGAALEILRIVSAEMGLEVSVIKRIKEFDETLIASVLFHSRKSQAISVSNADLAEGIGLRCTNRKNAERVILGDEVFAQLKAYAVQDGLTLEICQSAEELRELATVLGGMDRLRILHDQGYKDFINEIRWTEEEAIETKDGIDLETLEMGNAERAALNLVRDPGTVEFFRKNDLGYGLSKISDQTTLTSSAVMMLQGDFSPEGYLRAGSSLQKIWTRANLQGYSIQPVSASLFIFHRVENEEDSGFTSAEKSLVLHYKKKLNKVFTINAKRKELFMVRINKAEETSKRSFRKDVSDSLIIL